MNNLIERIEHDHAKTKKADEQFAITFLEQNSPTDRSSVGLNGQYLQFELLIETLQRIEPSEEDKKELLALCKKKYKDNRKELKNINDFERNYKCDEALTWYTKESFLYRMLNKALRVQNTHLLYLLRFFIFDLSKAIEKYRCLNPIVTYRCQLISKNEVRGLANAIGKLISMNSFLSTSLDRKQALKFTDASDDLEQVFFEIHADPRIRGVKPFADVSLQSVHYDEKEILMAIGSLHRVENVFRTENNIWEIKMKLCSEFESNLRNTLEYLRTEIRICGHEEKRLLFARRLLAMNRLDETESHLTFLYKKLPPDHNDAAMLYTTFGELSFEKDDLDNSLKWHQKALERRVQTLEPNHSDIADSYNHIGNIYARKENFEEAHKAYRKALDIWKTNFGEESQAVATGLSNIGNVFNQQKLYTDAFQHHNKALIIRKKLLPCTHQDIAASYNNLGLLNRETGRLEEAIRYFEQSLIIKEKCFPYQHPSIASVWENIACVYEKHYDWKNALAYYRKATDCYYFNYGNTHKKYINAEKSFRRIEKTMKLK